MEHSVKFWGIIWLELETIKTIRCGQKLETQLHSHDNFFYQTHFAFKLLDPCHQDSSIYHSWFSLNQFCLV
jgi:hypothetical protein